MLCFRMGFSHHGAAVFPVSFAASLYASCIILFYDSCVSGNGGRDENRDVIMVGRSSLSRRFSLLCSRSLMSGSRGLTGAGTGRPQRRIGGLMLANLITLGYHSLTVVLARANGGPAPSSGSLLEK